MTSAYSPFFEGTQVQTLTLDMLRENGDFDETSTPAEPYLKGKTLAMYYATWCPACQRFKENLIKAAEILSKHGIHVVAMDMSDANQILQSRVNKFRYKIEYFPTIIGFYNGKAYSIYKRDPNAKTEQEIVADLLSYVKNLGNNKMMKR
jgi:thiol-disulfide isomerase/thioredoxin